MRTSISHNINEPYSFPIHVPPLRETGGHRFDSGPRHTKVVKNGTSCSSLGFQTYEVELGLVNLVSG